MQLFITPEAKNRLDCYVDAVHGEISGLGLAKVDNGDVTITDIFILQQDCTTIGTELNPDAVAKFYDTYIRAGKDTELLKVWWHSHGAGTLFWSGTDMKTAAGFGNGWMVSIVTNKAQEYKCRVDVYDPFPMTVDNIPLQLLCPEPSVELRQQVKAEVNRLVQTYKVKKQKGYSYGGRYGERWERYV